MQINLLNSYTNFKACKKQLSLEKHKELAMRFAKEGLTLSDVDKAANKFPQMDNCHPYTIERNIREFVNLYKKDRE